MELLANLELGLVTALSTQNLLYCLLGVTLGMLIGVLPGIGHFAAISMLLPLTFHVPTTAALVMLAGIYYGAQYGGSICSILLNLPGTASSAVVCLDGYPMSRQGRAGIAIFLTTIASFVGSIIAIAVLIAMAPPLARVALSFTSPEYFAMMLLGLVAAATLVQSGPLTGGASVIIGILLGLVGTDVNTGILRFTFGVPQFFDGISLVALAMALFGVTEVISSVGQGDPHSAGRQKITYRSLLPSREDLRRSIWPTLRGSAAGTGIGILPGTGGSSIASFLAYALEKRTSKTPEIFGKGAVEGITAPEGANNAAAQSAFIPTLTLGIPGDAIMALMLGALMIHGVQPGPRVITEDPELFWGLVMSFLIGNIMLVFLNIPLIGVWVRILQIPYHLLFPAVILLVCIGIYSVTYSHVDVITVAVFAGIGYLLILLRFEPAPMLLGFILGPLIEENFRRALLVSNGDLTIFLTRPISCAFMVITLLLLFWVIATSPMFRKRKASVSEA